MIGSINRYGCSAALKRCVSVRNVNSQHITTIGKSTSIQLLRQFSPPLTETKSSFRKLVNNSSLLGWPLFLFASAALADNHAARCEDDGDDVLETLKKTAGKAKRDMESFDFSILYDQTVDSMGSKVRILVRFGILSLSPKPKRESSFVIFVACA